MVNIGNDWDKYLKNEFEKEYYLSLREFLKKEYYLCTQDEIRVTGTFKVPLFIA